MSTEPTQTTQQNLSVREGHLKELNASLNRGKCFSDFISQEVIKKFQDYIAEYKNTHGSDEDIENFELCLKKYISFSQKVMELEIEDPIARADAILKLYLADDNYKNITLLNRYANKVFAKHPAGIRYDVRGLQLQSITTSIMSTFVKYPLCFREILKTTKDDHPDYQRIDTLNKGFANAVNKLNEYKGEIENVESFRNFQGGKLNRAETFVGSSVIGRLRSSFGNTSTPSTVLVNRSVQNAGSSLLKYVGDPQLPTGQKEKLLKELVEAHGSMSRKLNKKLETQDTRELTETEQQDKAQLEEYIKIFDHYIKELQSNLSNEAKNKVLEKQQSEADRPRPALSEQAVEEGNEILRVASNEMVNKVSDPTLPSIPIQELPADIGSYILEGSKTGGRNNEGAQTGRYKFERQGFQDAKLLLKHDEPAKMLAEFIAGRAIRHSCGDIAPEIILVQGQDGVYLGSRLINGFTDLYKLVDPTLEDRYPGLEVVHQQKIGEVLSDFPQEVARFSAICWLVGDFDRHSGNIGVVGRDASKNKKGILKVLDFGGAFKNLEDEVHPHSISKHLPWNGPINFFYLFPRELRISRPMADELHRVAEDKTIVEGILKAVDDAANFEGFSAKDLCEFGERLGMTDLETLKAGGDKKACAEEIKKYVKTKMENRQKSLKQFALEIEIDLCIKQDEEGKFSVDLDALKKLVQQNPEYFNERLKDKSFHFRDDAHRGSFFERMTLNTTKKQLSKLMIEAIHEARDEIDAKQQATRSVNLSLLDVKHAQQLRAQVNHAKAQSIQSDSNGVVTALVEGETRDTEVRLFSEGAYYGLQHEDVIHRIEFYFDTAVKAAGEHYNSDPDLLDIKLKLLEEKRSYFIGRAREIEIDSKKMRSENAEQYFKPINDQIKSLYSEALDEILMGVYGKPGETFDEKASYREFKKTSQQLLIERGRNNVVHVYDDVISAQCPVGATSYPSEYRSSETPGVIPNASTDIYVFDNGVVSRAHRAASLSVLGLKGEKNKSKRLLLNYTNARSYVTDIASMVVESQNDLKAGDTIVLPLDVNSLLSPLLEKKMESIVVKILKTFGIDYKGETRQLKDLYLALGAMNGQTLQIDLPNGQGKVNVKLDITVTNLPVGIDPESKPFRLLDGIGVQPKDIMSDLQSTANVSGIGKTLNIQQKLIREWAQSSQSPSAKEISSFLDDIKSDETLHKQIRHLERERELLYKEMIALLEKDDPEYLKIRSEILANDKKVEKLYKDIELQMKEKFESQDINELRQKIRTELEGGQVQNPSDKNHLQQTLYLLDVMEYYFNGKYIESENSYLFSSMLSELGRLSGREQLVNCKSAKDRTQRKRELDALLVKATNDPERKNVPLSFSDSSTKAYIEKHLPTLARYSSGLRLIDQNSPGARGNRRPLPFGLGDFVGVMASKWQKVKPGKSKVNFEHSVPDVEQHAAELLVYEKVENPELRQNFMRQALERLYDGRISKLLSKGQISELNHSFSRHSANIAEMPSHYIEFLNITEMSDCREIFKRAQKLHHLIMVDTSELKLSDIDFQDQINEFHEKYISAFKNSSEPDPVRIKSAGYIIVSLHEQLTNAIKTLEQMNEKFDLGINPEKLKALIGDSKFEAYQQMLSSLDQRLENLNSQLVALNGYRDQLNRIVEPLLMNSEKREAAREAKVQLPNQAELMKELANTIAAHKPEAEVELERPTVSPAA